MIYSSRGADCDNRGKSEFFKPTNRDNKFLDCNIRIRSEEEGSNSKISKIESGHWNNNRQ